MTIEKLREFTERHGEFPGGWLDELTKYSREQLQFFAFEHLPVHLGVISKAFALLAVEVVATIPDNQHRVQALSHLLAAKDAALRAVLYK